MSRGGTARPISRPGWRWSGTHLLLAALAFFPSSFLDARAAEPLVDVSAAAGLDFVHENGMSGRLYFSEMMGPGGALFDFDNDGDLDIFLIQGHPLGNDAAAGPEYRDRLYRNDLEVMADGGRRVRLTDVTEASGIEAAARGYGYGVATGDVDNDGWPDLLVTNWGANVLWRNNGDGTFADITERSGVGDPAWGTSATFLDYDRDGWLDLFVANYVRYDYGNDKPCFAPSSARDYCGPQAFPAQPDRLYRNLGDGRFREMPLDPGDAPWGGALGVVAADFDGDGWTDLYVANDGSENHLWINQAGKGFVNDATLAGVAVNREGKPEASMGLDAADFDGDGDEDLFLTHLAGETNTLYVNDGTATFDDRTVLSGLGQPSWVFTAFGTGWFDLDADNRLDLFVANGEVKRIASQVKAGDALPLKQRNQLFVQRDNGRYEELSTSSGELFGLSEVGRGAALGDIDNDGDVDVLLVNNGGPARLLENRAQRRNPKWAGFRVVGGRGGRDQLGARLRIHFADGEDLWRRAYADGSYCSARDARVVVAVPENGRIEWVEVLWPDGSKERFSEIETGGYQTLRQGGASGS